MKKQLSSVANKDMILSRLMVDSLSKGGRTLLGEKETKDKAVLVARVVSAHAGKFYNGGVFTPDGVKDALVTWPGRPVLDGDHYASPIGTVFKAQYRALRSGKFEEKDSYSLSADDGLGEEVLWIAINDPAAAEKIADGRYSRISTSRYPDKEDSSASVCSICSSPSIGRMACNGTKNQDVDGDPQHHWYGDTYKVKDKEGNVVDERKAYSIMSKWSNVHVAFIGDGFSADPLTGVEAIEKNSLAVDQTEELTEDNATLRFYAVMRDGDNRIVDLSDTDNKDVKKNLQESEVSILLDSLNSGPRDESLPTIYPTGINGNQLTQDQFELVKSLLGSKALRTSQMSGLPDNAFVTNDRSFPAHNPTYVSAGLLLLKQLDSDSLPDDYRDEIHYELRRRENLFGSQRSFDSELNDEDFAKAHIIYSLVKAGCLSDESKLEDEQSYKTLLDEIRKDKITFDRLKQVRGSDGIGPSGCLPVHTDSHRKYTISILRNGDYKGPVNRDALLTSIGEPPVIKPDPPKNHTTKEEVDQMEITLQLVLDWLKDKATEGDTAKIVEDSKVVKVIETKVKAAEGLKDSEITAITKKLADAEKYVRETIVDEILDLKLKAGKIAVTYKDRAGENYKAFVAAHSEKSLDSLRSIKDTLCEFVAPTATESTKPAETVKPITDSVEDEGEKPEPTQKDPVKDGMGW